jgi:hypothetical protein
MVKRPTRKPVAKVNVKATKDQIVEKVRNLIYFGESENFFDDLCSKGTNLLDEVRTLLEMEKTVPELRFVLETEATFLDIDDIHEPSEYEITIKHKKSGKLLNYSLVDIESDQRYW